jgi:hypothetical protein
MAVTIPGLWQRVAGDETRAGQPISVGWQEDPKSITRFLNQAWVYDVRAHSAVLSCPIGVPGIGAGTWITIGRGRIRVWDHDARIRLRVYGGYVRTRVIIGGAVALQVDIAVAGPVWINNSVTILGASIDSDGLTDIQIEAWAPFGQPADLRHVVVEETENTAPLGVNLPDGSQPRTQFIALDDDAASIPDRPYDVWLAQAWDDNRVALRGPLRSRGICHLYPETRPHRLSSAFWRCDGPYIVPSQPWADRIRVLVSMHLDSGNSGEMFVFSDMERAEDVRDDRRVSLSVGLTHSEFEVGIRPGADEMTLVWIAFRTTILDSTGTTAELGRINPRRALAYCSDLPNAWAPMPDDKVLLLGSDSGHAGAKGGTVDWSFQPPAAVADLAAIPGSDSSVSQLDRVYERILISPHPETGYIDSSGMESVYDPISTAQTYGAPFEVFNLSVMRLTGILLEATGEDEERKRAAKYGALPTAGVPMRVISTINSHQTFGTPVLMARHPGERNVVGDTGNPNTQVLHEGHWLFVPGTNQSPGTYDVEMPLPVDPNYGIVSGLLSQTITARVVYMVVPIQIQGVIREADVSFRLLQGATLGPERNEQVQLQMAQGSAPNRRMTVYDAMGAASTVAVDPVALGPYEHVEHAYTQQYTDPEDGTQGGPWIVSRPVDILLSALGAFPGLITLRITNNGLPDSVSSTTMIVVAGLTLYASPRQ